MTRRISIPLDAPALARGVGFFETILVVRGRPVLLAEHYARIASGTQSIGLPSPSRESFEHEAAKAALEVAALAEASLRISWLAIGTRIEEPRSWRLYALAAPIPDATLRRRRYGRVVILPAQFARSSPELKTVSYIPSVLGLREAQARGADEALFTDARGRVLEGTTSNVFAMRGATLITPPVAAGLLPGVMRGWVIRNASRVGLELRERTLTREDLLGGSFLTGSLTKLSRIRDVDGVRSQSPGPVLVRLARMFAREEL